MMCLYILYIVDFSEHFFCVYVDGGGVQEMRGVAWIVSLGGGVGGVGTAIYLLCFVKKKKKIALDGNDVNEVPSSV